MNAVNPNIKQTTFIVSRNTVWNNLTCNLFIQILLLLKFLSAEMTSKR